MKRIQRVHRTREGHRSVGAGSRRSAGPVWRIVLLILGGLLAATVPVDAKKQVSVQGRVLLEGGGGLADWPVALIATQRYVEFNNRTSGGRVTHVASTRTDSNGYFSFEVPRERGYHFLYLRFHDPKEFDPVKYAIPEDIEITAMIRGGQLASVDKTIRNHPDWDKVRRMISESGGPSTPKGRILTTIGLPEERKQNEQGEEEWWYFTRGIVYTFRGSEPTGSRRFDPVEPPPEEAG